MKKILTALAIAISALAFVPAYAADTGSQGGYSTMVPAAVATGSRTVSYYTYSEDGATLACVPVVPGKIVRSYGKCVGDRIYVPIEQVPPVGKTFAGHGYISTKNDIHLIIYWK